MAFKLHELLIGCQNRQPVSQLQNFCKGNEKKKELHVKFPHFNSDEANKNGKEKGKKKGDAKTCNL